LGEIVGGGDADTRERYRLISADGHLNGPGDIWISRVASKYRDRVPRIERFDAGDAWVCEGLPPKPFGWEACAGRSPSELVDWCRYEEIHPGGYDPKARVAELTEDGVDAELLFPMGFVSSYVTGTEDPALHYEMVRAYNDFLAEFCGYAPERLGGAAWLPSRGLEQALEEVARCAEAPGLRAWLLKCYPHGDTTLRPEDDALWAAVVETGKPLVIHVSLSSAMPPAQPMQANTLPGTLHFYDAPRRMLEFIFGGVLDRFPQLKIILAEVDCGWMPYFAEQADDNYLRHSRADLRDVTLSMLPSEYMRSFFFPTFITDQYGIANRHRIGTERMLWSNDYPHITSDWPYSWKTINAAFADVPVEERNAILAGNAQRLLGFGVR
jgi:predicted TIM-barrel fold metal-dependent hydrolase